MTLGEQFANAIKPLGELLKLIGREVADLRVNQNVLDARINAIEARLDNDETYKMEQNERR